MRRYSDIIRRAFALIGTERRWRWYLLIAMSFSLTALEAIGASLIYLLVSLITAPDASVTLPLIGDLAAIFPGLTSRELRTGAALTVAAFFVSRGVYLLALDYVQNRLIANSAALMAGELLDGYLSMPYLFHTKKSSAELIRNTYTGVQRILSGIVVPALTLLTKVLLSVALISTLVVLAPGAMLFATIMLGVTIWFIQRRVTPRVIRLAKRSEVASKDSIGAIQQALGGIRDIKLLQRESAFARLHLDQQLIVARNTYKSSVLTSLSPIAIETTLILTIVGVFILSTTGIAGDVNPLPTLALFAYVGLRLQPVLQEIVSHINRFNKNIPMLEIIERDRADIAAWAAAVESEVPAIVDRPDRPTFQEAVRFEQVSFRYGQDDPEVLHAVDLEIRRGEFIGICGPTGGGKSTLVDLLVGLLQPTSGRITVDGVPLGRRPLWWWERLGVVSQQVFLTDDTLRNNIAFGESGGGHIDEGRLARCVERAQLRSVLEALPDGLDTRVGERGVKLSGGQRQRVAIARALYREPEVLVLDEGTSALDGATERALVAAIDEATHERTLIAIAHRISTIRNADRILVVADGRIIDTGTHDELLARNALFQALA